MKKIITYLILFLVLGGGFWVFNKYYFSVNGLQEGTNVLAEIKLDETEIKNLANIRLDTTIFRDLKFISLKEAMKADRPSVILGNKDIFQEPEEKPAP